MLLPIVYFVCLAGGIYEIFWQGYSPLWVIAGTIIASWLAGMQWGELVEKFQHMHHLWNSPFGAGSSIQHRE